MKAITTKCLGSTNFKESRVKASTDGNSITIGYDYFLSPEDNHKAAMIALCKKLEWTNTSWACGSTDTGYVFVQTNDVFKVD